MRLIREPRNQATRAKAQASRVPLITTGSDQNGIVFEEVLRKRTVRHVNTAGHIQALAENGVKLTIVEGYDRYVAWCEAQDPIEPLLVPEA